MLSENLGRVFVYDGRQPMLGAFKDMLNSRSLSMFGTDNIYQLMQYSRAIAPDLIIFNLSDETQTAEKLIKYLEQPFQLCYSPIVVLLKENQKIKTNSLIAHYLRMPADMAALDDIMESYSTGYKQHQILLLDNYSGENDKLHIALQQKKYSVFEVHNEEAARPYLQKNNPQIVCVEYVPNLITAWHTLPHEQIFYVDRQQDITEIEKFLH